MAPTPVVIEKFGGLDLHADPGDSRAALDAMNVTLEPGRVRTRDGTSLLFTTVGVPVFAFQHTSAGLVQRLLVGELGAPGALTAISTTGAVIATSTMPDARAGGLSAVTVGSPSAAYTYIAGRFSSVIRRFDGSAWTTPAAAAFTNPTDALGHMQTDNRLVICNAERASFSDPGAPETFGANNYVELGVGDGQRIHGCAWFNNQLFVFKRTKFFVFYGNSVDGTGEPVFNYRTVDAGVGMWDQSPQAVCVGSNGVYFIANDGVYRTTGSYAVKVSAPLDPFFSDDANAFWLGGVWDSSAPGQRLAWLDGCLHVSLPTVGGGRVLFVWDTQLDAWSCHGHASLAVAGFPALPGVGGKPVLVVGNATTKMLRANPGSALDDATAFASRYRQSFESFGSPQQKLVREAILEGTGTPTLQWSHDWGDLEAGGAVALGATLATKRRRRAVRGRYFSLQAGASSGAWSLNRVQVNLDTLARPPGVTV